MFCRAILWLAVWLARFSFVGLSAAAEADKFGHWPQWRGPHRNGISDEKGLLKSWETKQPSLLWQTEGLGEGFASVSVAAGRIYSTGNVNGKQGVIALDAADGRLLWVAPITESVPKHDHSGSRTTPTVDDDRLYVVTSDGRIACLKTADGALVWQKEFQKEWEGKMMSGWGFSESPLVDGDRVLCTPGGKDATLVALNKMTGDEVWRCAVPDFGSKKKGGAAYSSIVISNGAGVKQYVQMIGKGLVGVRASDGKFLWGYDGAANGTANISTPLPEGDFVFCSTSYDTGTGLVKLSAEGDGVKAEEVYFIDPKKLQNHHGGMIMLGDYVYCGHGRNNGFPVCVEWKTGKIMWGGEQRGAGSGSAAITYADGNLVFRYQSGDVALVEATPEAYKLKGSFKPAYKERDSWAHPVIAGGRLYLREQNKLMCYDVRE